MDDKNFFNENAEQTEVQEKIRELTDDIQIPSSLEPEQIEKMLSGRKKKRRRKYIGIYSGVAAAACICLAVGVMGYQGEKSTGLQENSQKEENMETDSLTSQIRTAEDYEEIYNYIREQKKAEERMTTSYSDGAAGISMEDSAANMGSGQKSAYYSDTNVRTEGVGEADTVKTDGESIFTVNGEAVEIVGITSDTMEKLSEIKMNDNCFVSEVYVENDILLVMYTKQEYDDGASGYDGMYKEYTCTAVYDISDRRTPEKISEISQSGSYNTMRVRDGYAYVLSDYVIPSEFARPEPRTYIPEVQGDVMPISDIYMPQREMGNAYTVITAFSLDDPSQKTDSKAVFGTAGQCYVSTESIYITEAYYDNNDADVTQTSIRKITYDNGRLTGTAQTKVAGTLNDSFSIDEYGGYLRMVTTVTDIQPSKDRGILGQFIDDSAAVATSEQADSNSLYILDENLKMTGKITNLAPDEQIYSARLMGETGYFVTFRQVDPLFSADLSDPHNPKIIGELKIPGFSEYLHPYGQGKLLGIGMDVDEESVSAEGVKLSMFDISDPANVVEENKYILEDMYGTDAGYDYRAVFVDTDKNIFGFLSYGDSSVYTLFTYDDKAGFSEIFSRELTWYGGVRGLYSGDRFYLVSANTIESYNFSDFKKIDDIVL